MSRPKTIRVWLDANRTVDLTEAESASLYAIADRDGCTVKEAFSRLVKTGLDLVRRDGMLSADQTAN